MSRMVAIALVAGAALAGCNQQPSQQQQPVQQIRVRSQEQEQLLQLSALNLAIALKRAIFDAGYSCKRVTDAGFIGTYKNLDMWMAHCVYDKGPPVDWAIFAGPDGSAQIRECKDIPGTGLPDCVIKQRPKGSFDAIK
jgi:hypothetical protein